MPYLERLDGCSSGSRQTRLHVVPRLGADAHQSDAGRYQRHGRRGVPALADFGRPWGGGTPGSRRVPAGPTVRPLLAHRKRSKWNAERVGTGSDFGSDSPGLGRRPMALGRPLGKGGLPWPNQGHWLAPLAALRGNFSAGTRARQPAAHAALPLLGSGERAHLMV